MSELKPCPFCGNKMDGYPDYTISFKRDKKKVYGIYHEICTLHCNRCTCTIRQAGATKDEAERHAYNIWNKRADMRSEQDDIEPQRMRGKWNVYYHGEENGKSIFSYSCNQCGYGAPYNFIGGVCEQKKWNFCPNCGADMREAE